MNLRNSIEAEERKSVFGIEDNNFESKISEDKVVLISEDD